MCMLVSISIGVCLCFTCVPAKAGGSPLLSGGFQECVCGYFIEALVVILSAYHSFGTPLQRASLRTFKLELTGYRCRYKCH